MNEMLGNQYFLARRFKDASNQFEKALLIDPENNGIKKKLIICYLQIREIHLALKLFTDLVSENIEILLKQDPKNLDCPCKQMINEIENHPSRLSELERNTILGILWTYCDAFHSKQYFSRLRELDPKNLQYKKIYNKLNNSISQKRKETRNGKERYYS